MDTASKLVETCADLLRGMIVEANRLLDGKSLRLAAVDVDPGEPGGVGPSLLVTAVDRAGETGRALPQLRATPTDAALLRFEVTGYGSEAFSLRLVDPASDDIHAALGEVVAAFILICLRRRRGDG